MAVNIVGGDFPSSIVFNFLHRYMVVQIVHLVGPRGTRVVQSST